MRLYSPVDSTGNVTNVNMVEKLVLSGTGTGDLRFSARPLCHQVTLNPPMNEVPLTRFRKKFIGVRVDCGWFVSHSKSLQQEQRV